MINLGNLLQIFNIGLFVRVMEVRQKITNDKLLVHDIQDIKRLCDVVKENDQINNSLRTDISELSDILDVFINVASFPNRDCGLWSNISFI